VVLSCARWPAYIQGKRQDRCFPCMMNNVVKPGIGKVETAPSDDSSYLAGLSISPEFSCLIGKSWNDREGSSEQRFVLTDVRWIFIDSNDGEHVPMLVGYYASESQGGKEYWSTMSEISIWIKEEVVLGPLSDREMRSLRRAAVREGQESKRQETSGSHEEDETVLINHMRDGYVLKDIKQRASMPDGTVSYQVVYEVSKPNRSVEEIYVWEPSSAVPLVAIQKWRQLQASFKYTIEELELQKNCVGSLKERQAKSKVKTSAGVFATILNCGIIISLINMHGHESLSQTWCHIAKLYREHGDDLPADFGYDDGCHLRKFSELRKDKTPQASAFWERVGKHIFVDRFHWKNHKDTHVYCRQNCNPDKNKRLDGANTEICEQSFRWFARHKYSINNMTPGRFRFFLTIIADRRNEIILSQRGEKCSK
jgi:hypothetical protein